MLSSPTLGDKNHRQTGEFDLLQTHLFPAVLKPDLPASRPVPYPCTGLVFFFRIRRTTNPTGIGGMNYLMGIRVFRKQLNSPVTAFDGEVSSEAGVFTIIGQYSQISTVVHDRGFSAKGRTIPPGRALRL